MVARDHEAAQLAEGRYQPRLKQSLGLARFKERTARPGWAR